MESELFEKIGGITLNYTYYPGEDLYSDGDVEDQLLEIARTCPREEYNRMITERKSWPTEGKSLRTPARPWRMPGSSLRMPRRNLRTVRRSMKRLWRKMRKPLRTPR